MNAAETLAALQEAGISLEVEDTSIVASPSSRLTDALRVAIRANKPQLVAALKPTAAYQAISEPDGIACSVTIVELPQAQRYRKVFAHLQLRAPTMVPIGRWQQAVEDGKRFLSRWGEQAEALGWSSADLFGLREIPTKPHPSYSRLSRYDCTGLIWLLEGRQVVALTETAATIRNPKSGNVTTYRRFNKPAPGPAIPWRISNDARISSAR
jgi:hypothetical protein